MTTTEITFDKLLYVDRLKSGGVAEQQARVHAEALDQALRDTVVTKQDLKQEISTIRQEIVAVRQGLKDDIRDLRTEMQTEFRDVRTEMQTGFRDVQTEFRDVHAEIARLDTKIDNTIALAVRDIKIWLGGIIIVAFGALASIKFFG